jgi:ATP-dependent RNA helicase DHX29
MAKKKKTQLRPVARGFATTSVPKKTPPPELPNVENRDDDIEKPLKVERGADEVLVAQGSGTGEQSLQHMVDKLQEKTEKEITRYFTETRSALRLTYNNGN